MNDNHLKTISKTNDELRVGNYIVLFGGRDLEWVRRGRNKDGSLGEFFSENTDLESAYTKAGLFHVDWEHGEGQEIDGDDAPGPEDVLGFVDWKTARKDKHGWWVERVLSRRNEYMKFLEELIEAGLVGTSSEPIQGKVVKGENGEIKVWPLKRDALTVSPAEPRMLTENVVTAMKSLADRFPSLKILKDPKTLAEKTAQVRQDMDRLLNDWRVFVKTIDRPPSETKRQELTELLGLCSGWDAVRSDLQSVLDTAPKPVKLVEQRRLKHRKAEIRKRHSFLQE